MKKTLAVIGSAAALSIPGVGLAAAQSDVPLPDVGSAGPVAETPADEAPGDDITTDDTAADDATEGEVPGDDTTGDDATDPETPAEVSKLAEQVCGAVVSFDALGSVAGIAPGLDGDDCAVTADEAITKAQSGDIAGAVELLRGVQVEAPEGEGEVADDATGTDTETEAGDDTAEATDAATDEVPATGAA